MPNNNEAGGGWVTPALLGAALGPAAQVQQPSLDPWTRYALVGALGLALAWWAVRGSPSRARPFCVVLAAALIAFGSCGLRAVQFSGHALAPALEGRDVAVVGVIASMPQRSETGARFRFQVESATVDGERVALPPQLYLGWYDRLPADGAETPPASGLPASLRAGQRWAMTLRLKAPHGNSNPHGFDYELWLWEQGLQATGYVRAGRNDAPPTLLAEGWSRPVERARQAVREAVFAHVEDRRTAGILAALVMGDQGAIERSDWDIFRATGVAHLMSISGLHITLFAWAAAWVLGRLWRRSARLCLAWPAPNAGLLGGIVLAAAYALFSGWGVPAQRTVWMLAATGLLRLSGRRWPWPQIWLLAGAVVVSVDPWSLLQAGFWLSFVAVGVLFATDPAARPVRAAGRLGHVSAAVRSALREQWVVTLALTPLSLLLFGQVSLVSLLANAFAIPWVTLVVTPLALGGVVLTPLWAVAAQAVHGLEIYLGWLASLPFAALSLAAAPLWAGVAGVAGGLLLALRLPWPLRLLGLPLLVPVLFWQPPRSAEGQFDLLAADVGQGNAVIVRTAHHTLLYDAGPRYGPESDAGHRVLAPLLRALDEQVDVVLLSHRDSDHTGGAAAVLAMQPHARLLSSIEAAHPLQAMRPSERCVAGQRWTWDGVAFEVLHPQAGDYGAGLKPNALSCVLRASNGDRTVLLAGDIEQAQEARLAAQAAPLLRADLLLVPHHGSKTSSSPAFLAAVAPSVALVQAGYRNRFGHPAEPVMARYRAGGVTTVLTARCGAARWRSDAPAGVSCEREAAPHYWQHRVSPE